MGIVQIVSRKSSQYILETYLIHYSVVIIRLNEIRNGLVMENKIWEIVLYCLFAFSIIYADIIISWFWKVVITKQQTNSEFFTGRK